MDLKADDLRPLIARLSHHERVRLARLALSQDATPADVKDVEGYRVLPVGADEFSSDAPDPLAWEPDGWDDVR